MDDTPWQRRDAWAGATVEDSFVMINMDTGTYLTLNRTASAVWNALETPQSQDDIERKLRDRFDVSEEACHASVSALLKQMQDLKLATAH